MTRKATSADVRRVIDLANLDQDGLGPDLAFAASLAACRATPGSWWTENATVYVNCGEGATVTAANTRAMLMTGNLAVMRAATGGNVYVSGFDVTGGWAPLYFVNSPTNRFVVEDCTFRYQSCDDGIVAPGTRNVSAGGVVMLNVAGATLIRRDAGANQADGFNSHVRGGVQAFVFKMDCTGFNNGRQRSLSNNFLTTHDGGKWIYGAASARVTQAGRSRSSMTTR